METSKLLNYSFPKWHLVCQEEYPENYSNFNSPDKEFIISEPVLAFTKKGKKLSLSVLRRMSNINEYYFYWTGISLDSTTKVPDDTEVIMWTFMPTDKYLKDEYSYLKNLSKTVF